MLSSIAKYIDDVSVLRRLLFAVSQLPKDLPNVWEIAVEFATNGKHSRSQVTSEQVKVFIENIQLLDARAFETDNIIFKELLAVEIRPKKPLGVVLISDRKECLLCGCKLLVRKDRGAPIVIYHHQLGTVPGTHFHKYCSGRGCGFNQYYGYYSKGGASSDIFFASNWMTLDYFVSSRETAFSRQLMEQFEASVFIGQQSFKQCADVYNYLNKGSNQQSDFNCLNERVTVDRRRIEEAFFQYALLKVIAWYPQHFSIGDLPLHAKTVHVLPSVVSTYHGAFMERYADHKCEKTGCTEVLILDGNLKNRRAVCSATHAGYIEYKGLPGRVRSGCQNTPTQDSSFCALHKPTLAMPQKVDSPDFGSSTTVNTEKEPVGIIVNKRTTRNSILYQVVWLGRTQADASWEPESTLPKGLIDEFEQGVPRTIEKHSFASGGQTQTTLSSQVVREISPPPTKRPHFDTPDCANTQFFVSHPEQPPLKCNTLKDKTQMRLHTAGILAGTRPCGTIVLIGELFGSESVSQAYGNVHTFLQENTNARDHLKCIVYDDACHLKRYACNPQRAKETETSWSIASCPTVVDRFHFPGHVDTWCREHCNPNKLEELINVDTERCEQLYSRGCQNTLAHEPGALSFLRSVYL